MATTEILTDVRGAVGIVRFNRPEARNALTDTLLYETRDALSAWERDRAIAAMVLAGNETAFSAGGDLKGTAGSQMGVFDKYRHRHTDAAWHDVMRYLGRVTKPLIAAVEGHALGGGLELMLRCDFAVGSETACLGLTEARLGVFPILGGAWSLTRAVGPRKAKELAFTARRIGAEEALALGLLNHVTKAGGALSKAVEIGEEIAANGPLAVMALKQAIDRAPGQSFDEALATGGDLSALLQFTADRKEGLAAFLEKRPPRFRGE